MAQQRHNIDTTQSMTIIDADSFNPETGTPDKDNQRIGLFPTVAYEGKNILPTDQGYKSFFGTKSVQDASGLPTNVSVQHIFVYQTGEYRNILVALTAAGVFMREQGASWEQVLTLPLPAADTDYLWTYAVVKNTVVMYRQDQTVFHVIEDYTNTSSANQADWTGLRISSLNFTAGQVAVAGAMTSKRVGLVAVTPTTLNMAGQVGLFRAGGSIGFWDSADAVAWSSLVNAGDFTPSKTTLANITGFKDLVGKITVIHGFGDGFVVYATKSVVRVVENSSALQRFQADSVYTSIGVSYPRQVAAAQPDDIHFAWTNTGLMQLNKEQEPQIIVTEVGDYLRKSRQPVYLRYINNRYLVLELTDKDIVFGNVEFSTQTVDPDDISYFPDNTTTVVDGIKVDGNTVCFTPDPERPQAGVKPFVVAPILEGNLRSPFPDNLTFESPVGKPDYPAFIPIQEYSLTDLQRSQPATIRQAGKIRTDDASLAAFVSEQLQQFQQQQQALASGWITEAELQSRVQAIAEGFQLPPIEYTIERDLANQDFDLHRLNDAQTLAYYAEDRAAASLPANANIPTIIVPPALASDAVADTSASFREYLNLETFNETGRGSKGCVIPDAVNYSVPPAAVVGKEAYRYPLPGLLGYRVQWEVHTRVWVSRYEYRSLVLQTFTTEQPIDRSNPWNNFYLGDRSIFNNYYHNEVLERASIDSGYIRTKLVRDGVNLTAAVFEAGEVLNANFPDHGPRSFTTYRRDRVIRNVRVFRPGGPPSEQAAIWERARALEEDTTFPASARAGLLAADTWWYSTNRDKDTLDETALVTPTLSLSTMEYGMSRAESSVDADGAFANRYYTYTDADGNGVADSLEQKLVCGTVKPIDIPQALVAPAQFQPWTIEIPQLTWQLENGNKAPVDPTFTAALVYDTQLQKWGNMELDYKQLVDYQPLTALDSNSAVTYENFVVDAGALLTNRNTCVFSDDPTESYIRYGKYRHWPAGTTAIEEVNVNYADPSSGAVTVQTSYNGRQLEYGQSNSIVFTDALRSELGCDMVGKWHTITVSGQFNLTHIEVVSSSSGRR